MTWHPDEELLAEILWNPNDAEDDDCKEAGYNGYCEDYPCCGHTALDPCSAQPYDAPDYYDTTIRGQEHRLCDHENGDCNVDYDDYDEDD